MTTSEQVLHELVLKLETRLGRLPTEDEVYDFITGDDDARLHIWNKTKEGK